MIIREGGDVASLLLRQIIGRIEADQVIPPGKSRGFSRLRFRIRAWKALKAIFTKADSRDALDRLSVNAAHVEFSDEFVIDLAGPTLMDQWAPKIAEMPWPSARIGRRSSKSPAWT